MKTNNKYKSPIKDKPLRRPGQSLEKKNIDIIFDEILLYMIIAIQFIGFAMFEWLHWFNVMTAKPWFFTVIAVLSIGLLLVKFIIANKKIKKNKQGLDGEREVGQYLDKLRALGFDVFHDVVFADFNIDHVVISKNGVFCIETKTYSKPIKGESKIKYDGKTVLVNGFRSRAPILQATAAAKSIQELIEQTTGKRFHVRPVLLFPGWFLESEHKEAQSKVWALNPKGFEKFAQNQKEQLDESEVSLISYHLTRYIKTL